MTRIYLIRHGEAEGNLYRRAQGHWNGKITARGKEQINALEKRFADVSIDAVWSSDLSRAMETAGAILRGRDLELHTSPRLREVCMGVWEGRPWGELQEKWPEQLWNFNNDPEKWQVPGSEDFHAAQERITSAVMDIAGQHPGESVAIVSHGMIIKLFLMGALGLRSGGPDTMMHGDNTSVSLLEIDGGSVRVVYYNDNGHLGPELSTFARQSWWRKDGPDPTSLHFLPLDPREKADGGLYAECYRDAWVAAHGSDHGFVRSVYLSAARAHARNDPEALVKAMGGDKLIGVLELDPERGTREGRGWISLLYLAPEYRGLGLGVQLIGYAAAYFEKKGRSAVRLHAAVTNEKAIGFYKHFGFEVVGTDSGVASEQLLLEKQL